MNTLNEPPGRTHDFEDREELLRGLAPPGKRAPTPEAGGTPRGEAGKRGSAPREEAPRAAPEEAPRPATP